MSGPNTTIKRKPVSQMNRGTRRATDMNSRDNQPIETLRISDRDKAKLLWAIDESSKRNVEDSQRRLRVNSGNTEVILTLISDNGSRTKLSVITRDLSRWGASVLHGRYVYPETRCELQIKALDGSWHTRTGEVRHSRHIQGLIHNLGIRFDASIDLSDFVMLSPDEETRHLQELADDQPHDDMGLVKQLVQRILIVDDFASDRKLFSYWLTRAGMDVVAVGDSNSAADQMENEQFDLVIVDSRLGTESGPDLIGKLRRSQYVGPILSVSASEDEEAEQAAISSGANAFLCKPFTSDDLVEAAFSLMGLDVDADLEPIYSTLNDDDEMRPLLTAFARGIPENIEQLHAANSTNDYDTMLEIVRTLKGAGSGYGLNEITELAGQALSELNSSEADMDKIKQSVNDLIAVLNRVKLR